MPNLFVAEIAKVRASLFQINGVKKEPLILPEAEGQVTTLTEKVYVPVREHPDVSTILIYILLVCPPEMCVVKSDSRNVRLARLE